MRSVVISGGTDGIGRALALQRLRAGDRVVVIGRNAAKGRSLGEEAGAGDRYHFIESDLLLVSESRRVVDEISRLLGRVDVLVLGAAYLRMNRVETAEGLEDAFALVSGAG